MTRRRTLMVMGAAVGRAADAADAWARHATIVKRIQAPVFAKRDFLVTKFGANGDGKTDNTGALRAAMEAAAKAGGGRVVVPEGVWLTGAVGLKSNVNLYVSKGAVVKFIPDAKLYPMVFTRWEGMECMNYSPFLYCYGQRNVGITGEGTLDGQAGCEHWWPWSGKARCGPKGGPDQRKARAALAEMVERGVAVEKRVMEGGWLRPQFIQPYKTDNVVIEGVTIVNSPMWEVNPVLCRNVTVRGLNISSHGPNNDGCNPESCTDVLIEGCTFDTGDDCIAIKSGRNADGRRIGVASENIVVQKCVMKDGHGGVTLGSECSGGIRNVFVQDCRMDSPNLERVLRFKNNAVRGGVLEHVYLRNVEVGQMSGAAIEVDFQYEEGANGPYTPVVRDVEVVGLRCRRAERALALRGYATAPVRDVRLRDCVFEETAKGNVVEHVEELRMEGVMINGKRI